MSFLERSIKQFDELWSAGSEFVSGAPPDGMLQRCNLRARVLAAAFMLAAVLVTRSLPFLVALYLICAVCALLSYIDVNRYLVRNLVLVGIFVCPMAILGSLRWVTPGQSFLRIGPVYFSVQGAKSATYVILRGLDSIGITMLLLRSAGINGVLRGLRDLRVPPGVVAALQLAIGHIHVLGRTAQGMVQGFRARSLSAISFRNAYSATATQGALLLNKSMTASRQVHAAMLARGFDGTFPVMIDTPPATPRDAVLVCVSLAMLVAGLLL